MKSLEIVNNLLSGKRAFFSIEQLEQIKQSLEVLEILRKHYKDIKVRPRLSNMKDLQKLKQWLEENENEICN